jgi:hypothetical protein
MSASIKTVWSAHTVLVPKRDRLYWPNYSWETIKWAINDPKISNNRPLFSATLGLGYQAPCNLTKGYIRHSAYVGKRHYQT